VDNRQAKDILILYREGIDRPDDPEFSEALALADRDPEVAKWLEQERAVHAALRASFKSIAVPEGLKEQIVSERRARTTLGVKQKMALAAAAAAVLVLLVTIVTTLSPQDGRENKTLSVFRTRMVSTAVRSYPEMDLYTSDLARIRDYLTKHGNGDYLLPAPLNKTASTGCKLLTWQGNPVTMICLNSGGNGKPKDPDLFLFVMNQSAVPDPSTANPRESVQVSKLSTLSWTQNGKLYLLGALGTSARNIQNSVAAELIQL
jgi:hypothetical protein